MGNIIPTIVLVIMFSAIVFYISRSLKTKGTTCTSCTHSNKRNKNQTKQDILQFYRKLNK